MTPREVLTEEDGENLAVRAFLLHYSGGGKGTVRGMQTHLRCSGFAGCWPAWVEEEPDTHLTKAGAQEWLRHLFGLEALASRQGEGADGRPAIERGYANLGIGAYLINHSRAGEVAELCITLATEADKVGRVVGDSIDNPPDAPDIQADEMVIRLRFANERGLFALEEQLRMVREVHFAPPSDASRGEGKCAFQKCGTPDDCARLGCAGTAVECTTCKGTGYMQPRAPSPESAGEQSTMDGTAGKPQGGQNIAGERAPEPTAESRCADTDTVRPPAPSTPPAPDGDAVIKEAVRRFLAWPLPKDFSPDCGITFTPDYNQHTPWPAKHEPVGTNLFTADQARAMFEHCLAAPPSQAQGETESR